MNTDKARRLLKKVQALFDNLSDQGTVSSLERDLLLSYLRELYEEFGNASTTLSAAQHRPYDGSSQSLKSREEDTAPVKSQPFGTHVPPSPVVPESPQTQTEQNLAPVETVPVERPAFVAEPVSSAHDAQVSGTGVSSLPKIQEDQDALAALFEFKGTGELAEKLTLQPIDRIEHGMGINERILSINELFNGDSELFKKTLEHLNGLSDFTDAKEFLMGDVASRFNWTDEAKKSKATFFIQLVRRRYVDSR